MPAAPIPVTGIAPTKRGIDRPAKESTPQMGLNYSLRHLLPPALVTVILGLVIAGMMWTAPTEHRAATAAPDTGLPERQATSLARLIGAAMIPLLAANDLSLIRQHLDEAKTLPGIEAVYILNDRDLIIAATDAAPGATVPETLRFTDSTNVLEEATLHTGQNLIVSEPLMLRREFLGRLHIVFATMADNTGPAPQSIPTLWLIGGIAAAAAVVALLLWYARIVRAEHRRLLSAADAMVEMAEKGGNLDTRLDDAGKDEFATLSYAFNVFYAKMTGVITLIMATSESLANEGDNMATHSAETRDRVVQQQNNLSEVVETINEMNITMGSVADSAGAAVESANEASRQASEGSTVLAATIDSINTLASQVNGASETISVLANAIHNIESVLTVIDSISEQTNLLALNAAIEAARAGDSGRGFAVVAEEVRNLSLQIQSETEGISKSINALQNDASRAVAEMQQGSTQAHATVEQADAANSALDAIMAAIAMIREMNHNIATSVDTQSQQTAQLKTKISFVSEIAEETAAAATQNSQVSHELSLMAGQLKGLIHNVILTAHLEDAESPEEKSDDEPELF